MAKSDLQRCGSPPLADDNESVPATSGASTNPVHMIQHHLADRYAAHSASPSLSLPLRSPIADRLEKGIAFASRCAGPVALVAAIAGILALLS